jgi:hypothetical protein
VREWDKRNVEKKSMRKVLTGNAEDKAVFAYFMNLCAIEGCGTARSSNRYIVSLEIRWRV